MSCFASSVFPDMLLRIFFKYFYFLFYQKLLFQDFLLGIFLFLISSIPFLLSSIKIIWALLISLLELLSSSIMFLNSRICALFSFGYFIFALCHKYHKKSKCRVFITSNISEAGFNPPLVNNKFILLAMVIFDFSMRFISSGVISPS